MRAQCEQCDGFQPVDWQAGDLCTHCGGAVRREVRCYWCVKWTPFAKFCRGCGAAVVEERLYGAARMLKEAGSDRFAIVNQLRDFDPEQIENFSRIYQRHAVTVARHVDELRFAEGFLRQRLWSQKLEDQLLSQLPWSDELLDRYSARPPAPTSDVATEQLRALHANSPFDVTRAVAAVARLSLGEREAMADAESILHWDEDLAAEAALVLGGWRVRLHGRVRDQQTLVEVLRRSPFPHLAAPRLVGLGAESSLPDAPDTSAIADEPDEALELALARRDHDGLVAALGGDQLMRIAAGVALAQEGAAQPLCRPLEDGPDEVRQPILYTLAQARRPFPVLREVLLRLIETTADDSLRERAARILCQELMPGDALRIARASDSDRSIYQSLLRAETVDADALREVLDHMIAVGAFSMGQYGLEDVARSGRVGDDFVPRRFPDAGPRSRDALLHFAEAQLIARGGDRLHRFLLDVVFSATMVHDDPVEGRLTAWRCLQRFYRHGGDRRGEGPVRITGDGLRLVGPVAGFADNLTAMLRDRQITDNVFLAEVLANVLGTADELGAQAIAAEATSASRLVHACIHVLGVEPRASLHEAALKFLMLIGGKGSWLRDALAGVRANHKRGNHYSDKALETLQLALHGLPPRQEWKDLPSDYAAGRWHDADTETRHQLLQVVDHQIVHSRSEATEPVLLPILLRVGLIPDDAGITQFAAERYADRGRRRWDLSHIDNADVTTALGGAESTIDLLPGILDWAARRTDPAGLRMVQSLLRQPCPALIMALTHSTGNADAPASVIAHALVGLAASSREGQQVEALGAQAVVFLAAMAAVPALADTVRVAMADARPPATRKAASEWQALADQLAGPPATDPPMPEPSPTVVDLHAAHDPDAALRAAQAQQQHIAALTAELQQTLHCIMTGPGSPTEKTEATLRANTAFQDAIRKLFEP